MADGTPGPAILTVAEDPFAADQQLGADVLALSRRSSGWRGS